MKGISTSLPNVRIFLKRSSSGPPVPLVVIWAKLTSGNKVASTAEKSEIKRIIIKILRI